MTPRAAFVAFFAFSALIALGLGHPEAAVILLGVSAGAAIVQTVALRPSCELLRKSAPLALPLLVIVVVGAIHLSRWIALAAGFAFALIAWNWIVRPDLAAEQKAASRELRALTRLLGLSLLVVAIAIGLAYVLIDKGVADPQQTRDSIGGLAVTLFVAGIVLWVIALAIRLFSYGTNPMRLLVAASLAAAFVCVVINTGIIRGSGEVLGLGPATLIVIAGCALAAETLWVVGKDRRSDVLAAVVRCIGGAKPAGATSAPSGPAKLWRRLGRALDVVTRHARTAGLTAALLASLLLATASGVALTETSDQGSEASVPGAAGVRLERGPAPSQIARGLHGRRRDLALAEAFMPVLAFTSGQRWSPIDVSTYLDHPDPRIANATLTGPVRTRARRPAQGEAARVCDPDAIVTPCEPRVAANLPTRCPGLSNVPCYRLTIKCPRAELRCADGKLRARSAKPYTDGAVYVRVLSGHAAQRSSDDVVSDVGPFRRGAEHELWAIVQYWYFYRYDEWEQRVLPGNLVQRHESDWEAVTIGLAKDRPLFVGYSAHCGGAWSDWSPKAIPAAATSRPWTHPVVAVAEGSQANYARADQARPPNWDGCAGIPGITADLVSYAANVRDRTAYDWQWVPRRIIPVTSEIAPMSFPGRWGGYDETRLVNNADLDALAHGDGPKTPSLQPLWQDPIATIFCSARWKGPKWWNGLRRTGCAANAPIGRQGPTRGEVR